MKSLAGDLADSAYKAGLSLMIDKDYCDSHMHDPDCLKASKAAANVVDTPFGYQGIVDKINAVRDGLSGFQKDLFNQFLDGVNNLKSGGR